MENKIHNLKIAPEYFKGVVSGAKPFEIRLNDRDYKKKDILVLEEFDNKGFTGKYIHVEVTCVTRFIDGLKDNYVVLGIKHRLDRGVVL